MSWVRAVAPRAPARSAAVGRQSQSSIAKASRAATGLTLHPFGSAKTEMKRAGLWAGAAPVLGGRRTITLEDNTP